MEAQRKICYTDTLQRDQLSEMLLKEEVIGNPGSVNMENTALLDKSSHGGRMETKAWLE